jgi:WD40 repeat protein
VLGVKSPDKPKSLSMGWRARLDDCVADLRWSSDGRLLAAASVSGPIHVIEASTGIEILQLPGHGFGTPTISWRPGFPVLASGGQDGKVRIWNLERPAEPIAVEAGAPWAERVSWSPSGKHLASAAAKVLRLWSPEGQLLQDWRGHSSTIADIAWAPGTEQLTSCGYGLVFFWSPESTEPLRRFEWKGSMLKAAWSPDGKALATGNQDSTVHFWFVATAKDLQMWGYPAKIRELAWDEKSRYLATGGSSTIVVWDCSGKGPANTKPLMFEFHDKLLSDLAFQHHGPLLASGCAGGIVALWHVGKKEKAVAVDWLDSAVTAVRWSPDDRTLAVGDESGSVRLFAAP